MVNVISVKFKGGGKSYYFAPCKQELTKGMGVIVETSKGLEYATVTEGLHEVEDDQVVPPLMPVVRVATQKDLEQVERNEARKDEAMKIVREKIEARGLDMKPVGCEFSFDGTKVVVYFTSENRVDFRELIKDLSAAFHMRIELRQISIREEIKLMGGLAPCGRECCCVRSLQEPKKVSVKMAKNQGLSLNPGKISGLCGRLMCCLSYENDYYAEVCKKVPKLGSEATTPDGKGMVVNVNMLKMVVKVKIEQGDSVSYRDYPLDKISFMRGNEVIGTVGGDEEENDILPEDDETPVEEQKPAPEVIEENNAANGGKNEGRRNRDRINPKNRHGGKDEQGREAKQNGGKAPAKHHGKNRPKPNNENVQEHKANEADVNQSAPNKEGGAPNPHRNRKKHRGGKNQNGKENVGNTVNSNNSKNNA